MQGYLHVRQCAWTNERTDEPTSNWQKLHLTIFPSIFIFHLYCFGHMLLPLPCTIYIKLLSEGQNVLFSNHTIHYLICNNLEHFMSIFVPFWLQLIVFIVARGYEQLKFEFFFHTDFFGTHFVRAQNVCSPIYSSQFMQIFSYFAHLFTTKYIHCMSASFSCVFCRMNLQNHIISSRFSNFKSNKCQRIWPIWPQKSAKNVVAATAAATMKLSFTIKIIISL